MKKILTILSIVSLLIVNSTSAFAYVNYGSNYTYTTTTTENYSASSPVGQFSNYNATNAQPAVVAVNPYPAQDYYNYNYNVPVYTGNAYYGTNDTESQVVASNQNIEVPQNYTKTVTTTDTYVDTREKADKIINRGLKVIGGLALIGAVGAIIVGAID